MAKTSKPKATTSARKRMNAAAATQSKKPRQKGRIKEYFKGPDAYCQFSYWIMHHTSMPAELPDPGRW